MPAAYSVDLRERVIAAINNNMHINEAVKTFKVSRRTIYEWIELYKKTGNIIAITNYQKGHSHKIKDWNQFKIFVEKNKNCSVKFTRHGKFYSSWNGRRSSSRSLGIFNS